MPFSFFPARLTLACLALLCPGMPALAQPEQPLTLEQAVAGALREDPWLEANELREQALRQEAIAAGQLPDPMLNVGLSNLPLDSFHFNQEPMTQFRVGLRQSFPRGDTLELSSQRKRQQSEENPHLRADRRARLTLEVTRLWLDAWLAQRSIALIEAERDAFEQLAQAADARYRTAQGSFRQQDLVRAQVELSRLDERLIRLDYQLESARRRLAEWLPLDWTSRPLSGSLPQLPVPEHPPLSDLATAVRRFAAHPRVQAYEQRVEAALTRVELARQSYKPAFDVGASYGYRADGPAGVSRSDFFSLEFNMDLPLFTAKRQEPRVEAAYLEATALQTEQRLLYRELAADYQQAEAELARLERRLALYDGALLGQMSDLNAASMAAYTADEGDFEEVMQATINELNARIEQASVRVEALKQVARLNYLLTGTDN